MRCGIVLKLQTLVELGTFINVYDLTRVSHLPIDWVHRSVCNFDDDFVIGWIWYRAWSNFERVSVGGGNPGCFVLENWHREIVKSRSAGI